MVKLEKGVQIFNEKNDMELYNQYNDIQKMKKREKEKLYNDKINKINDEMNQEIVVNYNSWKKGILEKNDTNFSLFGENNSNINKDNNNFSLFNDIDNENNINDIDNENKNVIFNNNNNINNEKNEKEILRKKKKREKEKIKKKKKERIKKEIIKKRKEKIKKKMENINKEYENYLIHHVYPPPQLYLPLYYH